MRETPATLVPWCIASQASSHKWHSVPPEIAHQKCLPLWFDSYHWDFNFDFCFPIDSVSARPEDPEVRLKTLKSERYLKAIFNGNYRISQQGWYSLFDYAQRNNIALGSEIIEIYRNDPHEGGDSMQWVAELLIPILN